MRFQVLRKLSSSVRLAGLERGQFTNQGVKGRVVKLRIRAYP